MPWYMPEGNQPLPTDNEMRSLQKIVDLCGGGSGGGGVGPLGQEVFNGHYGNVAPTFVPPLNRGVAYDLSAPFVTWKWDPDSQTWT